MAEPCTFCGQDVTRHDPVYVSERVDGDRKRTGQFCNYACLQAHIEAADLTTDACCAWSP
ncbi:MAG: hypothetical protein ABEJ30_02985 [Halorientalis sp.]